MKTTTQTYWDYKVEWDKLGQRHDLPLVEKASELVKLCVAQKRLMNT
ncbi:MAG: hypothetical protein JOY95_08400 [Silvibacterium sp.]|nr:hypothetical protein [Silvibacterium sp.]